MTTPMAVLVVVAVVLVAWLLAGRYWDLTERRYDRLEYDASPPVKRGLWGLGYVLGESAERATWGSTVRDWERRCAASTQASRRRRGTS